MTEAACIFRVTQPHEYQRKFLEAGTRLDGRGLDEFRDAILSIGSVSTADGSALVAVGETKVICGIKAEMAAPKSDKPASGYIVPNVDLPSLASSEFKSGPPSELAQTATQFMLEVLLRSQCFQLENLCIAPGKMCWVLYCDLICLNYDGNLLDACTLALVSALCNVKLPAASVNEETGLIEVNFNERISLDITSWPVATTFSVFEKETMYVDPTSEEERQASLSVTIVTTNKIEDTADDQENICMIHKTGGGSLNEPQLLECLSTARKHTPAVLSLIKSTLSSSSKSD